jgi:hypothetical protein
MIRAVMPPPMVAPITNMMTKDRSTSFSTEFTFFLSRLIVSGENHSYGWKKPLGYAALYAFLLSKVGTLRGLIGTGAFSSGAGVPGAPQ